MLDAVSAVSLNIFLIKTNKPTDFLVSNQIKPEKSVNYFKHQITKQFFPPQSKAKLDGTSGGRNSFLFKLHFVFLYNHILSVKAEDPEKF